MQPKSTFTNKKDRFPTFRKIPPFLKRLFILLKGLFITVPRNIIASDTIRRRAGKTVKVLLLLVVILAVSYGAFDYYASFSLKREYAKIREQGQPLFFAEATANTIPDPENAALLYIEAAKKLKLPDGYNFEINAPQKLKSSVINDNPQVMPLVERAAQLKQSHFPAQANRTPDTWIHRNKKMRDLARFICLNAEENARQRNYTKAFQHIGYIDQLAARTANGDTLIGFLVACAIQGIEMRTTATILEDARLTKQQAKACFDLLPHSDWHQLFYDNMLGERTFNISSSEYLLSDTWNRSGNEEVEWDGDDSASFMHRGFIAQPLLKMNQVYLLRLWEKVLSQAKKPSAVDADFETEIKSQIDQIPFF